MLVGAQYHAAKQNAIGLNVWLQLCQEDEASVEGRLWRILDR